MTDARIIHNGGLAILLALCGACNLQSDLNVSVDAGGWDDLPCSDVHVTVEGDVHETIIQEAPEWIDEWDDVLRAEEARRLNEIADEFGDDAGVDDAEN